MAGYERKVEYLYEFDDGIRKNNAGFARMECMGDQCRVTVHITVSKLGESLAKVFLYYKNKDGLQRFPLGEFRTRNGSGNFRTSVKADQFSRAGFDFSRLEGVLVYLSDRRYFIPGETPLNFNMTVESKKEQPEPIPEQPILIREEIEVLPEEETAADIQMEEVMEDQIEEQLLSPPEELMQEAYEEPMIQEYNNEMPRDERMEWNLREGEVNPEPETVLSDEMQREEICKQTGKAQEEEGVQFQELPRAQRVFECCMRTFPFEDNEIQECVKLELADLGLLPMEQWPLVHNSFLLHSFYLYGHMLLAKKQGRCGYQYYLMVPGVFQNKERSIASRFGFRDFKCARKREQRQGEFGYWYLPVVFT